MLRRFYERVFNFLRNNPSLLLVGLLGKFLLTVAFLLCSGIALTRSGPSSDAHEGGIRATRPEVKSLSPPQPEAPCQDRPPSTTMQPFVVLFAGHSGSSSLMELLGSVPSVLVPGFEPLDVANATAAIKLGFIDALFFPPDFCAAARSERRAWFRAVSPPSLRLNRSRIRDVAFGRSNPRAIGFKMRPFVGASESSHTAMSGLDPYEVRALFHRHNVRLITMVRHDTAAQALSWYRARELQQNQFGLRALSRGGGRLSPSQAQSESGSISDLQLISGPEYSSSRPGPGSIGTGLVDVNVTRLLSYKRFSERTNDLIIQAASFFQRPTLAVVYEDFARSNAGELRRAVEFILGPDVESDSYSTSETADRAASEASLAMGGGLPRGYAEALVARASLHKASPGRLSDWVANAEEVRAALGVDANY